MNEKFDKANITLAIVIYMLTSFQKLANMQVLR